LVFGPHLEEIQNIDFLGHFMMKMKNFDPKLGCRKIFMGRRLDAPGQNHQTIIFSPIQVYLSFILFGFVVAAENKK
jgi:hypothetical protein